MLLVAAAAAVPAILITSGRIFDGGGSPVQYKYYVQIFKTTMIDVIDRVIKSRYTDKTLTGQVPAPDIVIK